MSVIRHKDMASAVRSGDSQSVVKLIEQGADLNEIREEGSTPLIMAVEHRRFKIVQILIDAGAKLDLQAWDGSTALMIAAEKGYANIVEVLVKAGANLDIQDCGDNTALDCAVWKGDRQAVQVLINAGAALNIQDDNGNTALISAARGAEGAIVHDLIRAGAILDIQNDEGQTALDCALEWSYKEIELTLRYAMDFYGHMEKARAQDLPAVENKASLSRVNPEYGVSNLMLYAMAGQFKKVMKHQISADTPVLHPIDLKQNDQDLFDLLLILDKTKQLSHVFNSAYWAGRQNNDATQELTDLYNALSDTQRQSVVYDYQVALSMMMLNQATREKRQHAPRLKRRFKT